MLKSIALIALLSTSAFADVPTYRVRQATCAEMQAAVAQYGSVNIVLKYLLGSETILVTKEEQDCDSWSYSEKMKIRDSEGYKCTVGYYCQEYPTSSN